MMSSACFIHWMGNKFYKRDNLRLVMPSDFDQIIEPFSGSAGLNLETVSEKVQKDIDILKATE